MSLLFKACLIVQRRQFTVQSNSFRKHLLDSLQTKNTAKTFRSLVPTRFYSSEDTKPPLETRERIYDGTLAKKIRFVKILSLSTSAAAILGQPYLIMNAMEHDKGPAVISAIILIFGFFSFASPLLLHFITKRYIVHVDYNPVKDNYIATTYTVFAQTKEIEFTPDDVHMPTMSDVLTSCVIKGLPMFIDVREFKDIDHYKRIMGFDKPMDFNINTEDIKTKKD